MDIPIKSLEKYIEQCVAEFSFNDFSPPISHNTLTSKFKKILYKENAYWEQVETEDKWDRWVFIHFKTFANILHPFALGLNFANNKIIFVLTKEMSYSDLSDKNKQTEISIFDIWLDHSKLTSTLYTLIKKGIEESNKSSS